MSIESFLNEKFPEARRKLYRKELLKVCSVFINSGHADSKFEIELTSGLDSTFWSCVSEAIIFQRLSNHQILKKPAGGTGPDFLITHNNRRIWIEVICPQPQGIPKEWLEPTIGVAVSTPHDAILLRWTSAIKEKTEKLIGNSTENTKGYLQSGIVQNSDVYVIAVNGCQLRSGHHDFNLHGPSLFPYAAEAVFPIGPFQIRIDRTTLTTVDTRHQVRFTIPKPNGASVPTHAFLDPNNNMVSAIWAVDLRGTVSGNSEPSALIHNPNAKNPLPVGLLTADKEYVATPGPDSNEYTFSRVS